MSKEKRKQDCCPCPLTLARQAFRRASSCEQMREATSAFMHAAAAEVNQRAPGRARERYERLIDAEFDRMAEKAAVQCQYGQSRSPRAVEAITRARLRVRQAVRQRARADEQSRARIDAALAQQRAAMTLQGIRPARPRGR